MIGCSVVKHVRQGVGDVGLTGISDVKSEAVKAGSGGVVNIGMGMRFGGGADLCEWAWWLALPRLSSWLP